MNDEMTDEMALEDELLWKAYYATRKAIKAIQRRNPADITLVMLSEAASLIYRARVSEDQL